MDGNDEPIFLMQLVDGYSFRNVFGMIKQQTVTCTMFISPDEIKFSFVSHTSQNGFKALNDITLHTAEFAKYLYNFRDEDGNLKYIHSVTYNAGDMFMTTKQIGRKDGIRIFMWEGDIRLHIQPIKVNARSSSQAGASYVRLLPPSDNNIFNPPSYETEEPNFRVPAKDFADICSNVGTTKCKKLVISAEKSQISFTGLLSNNTTSFFKLFHNNKHVPNDLKSAVNIHELDSKLNNTKISSAIQKSNVKLVVKNAEIIAGVEIPSDIVKALSKIHNISPSNTLIRFFAEKGKPVKFQSVIGNYGLYDIYVINKE